jgi:hypothetical protein
MGNGSSYRHAVVALALAHAGLGPSWYMQRAAECQGACSAILGGGRVEQRRQKGLTTVCREVMPPAL